MHARLHGVRALSAQGSAAVASLGAAHKEALISVQGTVVRANGLQLFEAYRSLECLECKTLVRVHMPVHDPTALAKPDECSKAGCDCGSFRMAEGVQPGYTNFQEVAIQVRMLSSLLLSVQLCDIVVPCHNAHLMHGSMALTGSACIIIPSAAMGMLFRLCNCSDELESTPIAEPAATNLPDQIKEKCDTHAGGQQQQQCGAAAQRLPGAAAA